MRFTEVGITHFSYMDEAYVDNILTEKGMKKITENKVSDKNELMH